MRPPIPKLPNPKKPSSQMIISTTAMVYNMLPMVVSDIGISDVISKTINIAKRLINMSERFFRAKLFKEIIVFIRGYQSGASLNE